MILLLLLLFASCSGPTPPPKEITGSAMTMSYRILVDEDVEVEEIIKATFAEVDAIYNNWNPTSEVSRLNQLPAGESTDLSPELFAFLKRVGKWVEQSDGLFDPTVAPLQRLWRERLTQGKRPSKEELAALAPCIGWNTVHLEAGRFWKEQDATSLDLGGVAKGYCVDLLLKRIRESGARHIYVEWAGEIATYGGHPEGRPWRIAIQKPEANAPPTPIEMVEMEEGALATSGNYHQAWETEEGLFTHICDPRTLEALPVTKKGVASATVRAESCFVADLLATVVMISPSRESATELVSHLPSCSQIWILDE